MWVHLLLLMVRGLLLPLRLFRSLFLPLLLLLNEWLLCHNMSGVSLLESDISSLLALHTTNNDRNDEDKEKDGTSCSHFNWFSAVVVPWSNISWLCISARNAGLIVTRRLSQNNGVVLLDVILISSLAAGLIAWAFIRFSALIEIVLLIRWWWWNISPWSSVCA